MHWHNSTVIPVVGFRLAGEVGPLDVTGADCVPGESLPLGLMGRGEEDTPPATPIYQPCNKISRSSTLVKNKVRNSVQDSDPDPDEFLLIQKITLDPTDKVPLTCSTEAEASLQSIFSCLCLHPPPSLGRSAVPKLPPSRTAGSLFEWLV
jgi:hypothetical protein